MNFIEIKDGYMLAFKHKDGLYADSFNRSYSVEFWHELENKVLNLKSK